MTKPQDDLKSINQTLKQINKNLKRIADQKTHSHYPFWRRIFDLEHVEKKSD